MALEPVTKIELDSDDEEKSAAKEGIASQPPIQTPETNTREEQPRRRSVESIESHTEAEKAVSTRPVRLKRNFRQRQLDDEHNEQNSENNEPTALNETEATNGKPENNSPKQAEETKNEEEKERSPTPDIIPIIFEPEILCISSSESENENSSSSIPKYISFPMVTKEKGPPTEDELFLQKIKEKSNTLAVANSNSNLATSSETQLKDSNDQNTNGGSADKQTDEAEKETLEEGEIIEDETEGHPEKADTLEINDDSSNSSNSSSSGSPSDEEREKDRQKTESDTVREENKRKSVDSETDDNNSQASQNSTVEIAEESSDNNEDPKTSTVDKEQGKDSDDEDIIDLGKYEDLDFDMKEMASEKSSSKNIDENQKQSSSQDVHVSSKQTKLFKIKFLKKRLPLSERIMGQKMVAWKKSDNCVGNLETGQQSSQ